MEVQSARVVIEVGAAAGWVKDLCEALEVPVQVAIYDWVMSDLAIGGDGRLTA